MARPVKGESILHCISSSTFADTVLLYHSPTKHATPSKHLSPVQHRSAVKFAASPLGGTSPSPSLGASRGAVPADWILPTVQAYILRMRGTPSSLFFTRRSRELTRGSDDAVALLRIENKIEESQALLHRLSKLGISEEDKAAEFKLLASIQFQDLLLRFTTDPVLGMLPESGTLLPSRVCVRGVELIGIARSPLDANSRSSSRRAHQDYDSSQRRCTFHSQLSKRGGDALESCSGVQCLPS